MADPDELRERVVHWRITQKKPAWVRSQLRTDGIPDAEIDAVIAAVYDETYTKKRQRMMLIRIIGILVMLSGIGLIIFTGQIRVIFVVWIVLGIAPIAMPDLFAGKI